jgi:hypothetical protein
MQHLRKPEQMPLAAKVMGNLFGEDLLSYQLQTTD